MTATIRYARSKTIQIRLPRLRRSGAIQQATACRGAMEGFIAEVIEDHIRDHLVGADDKVSAKLAAEELIGIVHSYLT